MTQEGKKEKIPVPAGVTIEHLVRQIRRGHITLNEVLDKYILKDLYVSYIKSGSTPRVYDGSNVRTNQLRQYINSLK